MALNVYFLPWSGNDFTNVILKEQLIHHAIVLPTDDIDIRKVIMNTNALTHDRLCFVAHSWRLPTTEERDEYASAAIFPPQDPDLLICEELLGQSSEAITQPEIWQLLRIFGRRLGLYHPN